MLREPRSDGGDRPHGPGATWTCHGRLGRLAQPDGSDGQNPGMGGRGHGHDCGPPPRAARRPRSGAP
eukprot:11435510-Alexandrium_andersonii.AAC.1